MPVTSGSRCCHLGLSSANTQRGTLVSKFQILYLTNSLWHNQASWTAPGNFWEVTVRGLSRPQCQATSVEHFDWWSIQIICRHATICQDHWNLLIPVPTGKRKCYSSKSPIKKEHLAKMDNLTPGAWEFRESRQKHPWVCHITWMWDFLLSFSFNFHNVATHMWTRNQDNQNINWLLQMFLHGTKIILIPSWQY